MILIVCLCGLLLNVFLRLPAIEHLVRSGSGEGAPGLDLNLLDFVVVPTPNECLNLLPASAILAAILMFEQMLYSEEIKQRKRRADHRHLFDKQAIDRSDLVGSREMVLLGLANIASGLLSGLPIAISLFATLEHFFQKEKLHYRGTKVVGLLQGVLCGVYLLPIFFELVPMWTLFSMIVIPFAYYFFHMRRLFENQWQVVAIIGVITVVTHPAFALMLGAFYTIY